MQVDALAETQVAPTPDQGEPTAAASTEAQHEPEPAEAKASTTTPHPETCAVPMSEAETQATDEGIPKDAEVNSVNSEPWIQTKMFRMPT